MYRELLLGCGHSRERRLDPYRYVPELAPDNRWQSVTTVDNDRCCNPDLLMELALMSWTVRGPTSAEQQTILELTNLDVSGGQWRFQDNVFDEAHAYEILEHLGPLGNAYKFFFDFDELWRILKPDGFLCATCPSRESQWLWGDPGHSRCILPVTLRFLHRPHYDIVVGRSPSSDYRNQFRSDWDIIYSDDTAEDRQTHKFVLRAVKPARAPAKGKR